MKNGSKGTILIAEDNPVNFKLLRDVLTYYNYRIIEAYDGKTAFDKIKEHKNDIDLILMDLRLPEMDGLDVIKAVKDNIHLKKLPIFVISAYAMESDIKSAMEAGCNNYITKPINVEDFLEKIEAFFRHCINI
jgi:two-component system, cell cycle response regulator DivK